MQAIHGGQAKTETIDAQKMAVVRRGGRRPQASVSPTQRRATRARRRRRRPLTRTRAELLAHRPHTQSPYHRPELGTQRADKAHRDGVAARVPEPAVPKRLEVERALLGHDDSRRTALELARVQTAKAHEAPTCSRVRSSPEVGQILALVRLDDIHALRRGPRGQACVASGRRVQWAKESAGTRDGTAGQKRGNADLTWAFSEAAGLGWRHHPAGQQDRARVEQQQRQGQARTVLAPHWARAVYDRWTRETAVALDQWCPACWSGAGEPAASRAAAGISLASACWER
jgi:hypothetical protein